MKNHKRGKRLALLRAKIAAACYLDEQGYCYATIPGGGTIFSDSKCLIKTPTPSYCCNYNWVVALSERGILHGDLKSYDLRWISALDFQPIKCVSPLDALAGVSLD